MNNNKLVILILLLFSLTLVLTSCKFPLYFDQYNTSGSVTDSNGNPIEQAVIKFDNGYDPVYTNSNGKWMKTGLGGTVTIEAHKTGYSFSPSEYTVTDDESNLDFVTEDIKLIPYNVSGKITDDNNNGIDNVVIRFSNGAEPVKTNIDGTWNKDNLKGEVTITPELKGYTFDPVSRTISGHDSYLDFTGTEAPADSYSVSGIVEDNSGNPIPDVTINFSSGDTVKTGTNGNWSKQGLGGLVTITPEKEDYTFSPSLVEVTEEKNNIVFTGTMIDQPYTASGTITYENNDQPIGEVEITFSENFDSVYTDSEGNWEKAGLTGEVDITPELTDWQFTPANITISQESETTNLDFSGKPGNNFEFYTISGIIVNTNYEPIPGVLIEIRRTEDNTLLGTAVTNDKGEWTEGNLWGTVTVTPDPSSKSTVSEFNPIEQVISGAEDNIDFLAQ